MVTNNSVNEPTAAAGTVLQGQGVGTASNFSTATYPSTTTANQLLFSSATNTVGGLATAASSTLVTDASSVPSLSQTLPSAVQGNITSTGTITSGTWHGSNVDLSHGGTNASLVASNGGVIYSTASAFAVLAGVGTSNKALVSQSGNAPQWSTVILPSTLTNNNMVYTNGTNTMAGLATANNGVLITSSGGVPSISSTLPTAVQGNITSLGNIGNQSNTTRAVAFGKLSADDSNVTGDGTTYVLGSGNVLTLTQQGTNLTTGGTFTAPVTGYYLVTVNLTSTGTAIATDGLLQLTGTNGTFNLVRHLPADTNGTSYNASIILNITSGNTVTISLTVSGTTKTVSISSANSGTTVGFYLLC